MVRVCERYMTSIMIIKRMIPARKNIQGLKRRLYEMTKIYIETMTLPSSAIRFPITLCACFTVKSVVLRLVLTISALVI